MNPKNAQKIFGEVKTKYAHVPLGFRFDKSPTTPIVTSGSDIKPLIPIDKDQYITPTDSQ
jgi:hypothetical protein